MDIILSASLPYSEPIPMPPAKALAQWVRETLGRLEGIEPLLPEQRSRVMKGGLLEVLAWREEPQLDVRCAPDGSLQLAGITLPAGLALDLPRQSESDEETDEPPDEDLKDLFKRLEGALRAWSESLTTCAETLFVSTNALTLIVHAWRLW